LLRLSGLVPRLEPERPCRVVPALLALFAMFEGEIRMLIGALITFLVVILILYLINLLPLDGRAKQIARVVVIILGIISLLKYIAVF
jgi:hypothetical protein